jgi:endonuclease G
MRGNIIVNKRIIHHKLSIVFFNVLIIAATGFSQPNESNVGWKINVELGIPKDADSTDDYLIKRDQYVIDYNKNKNVANWVSWNLNKTWIGEQNRVSGFIPDNKLPDGWYRVKTKDYTRSGYDRGHIVASKDRSISKDDNKATFFMTNIYPQEPDLNQGPWKVLEDYCRRLCLDSDKELYITAGGVFHTNKLLIDAIAIPDSCYKIIVILNRGQNLKSVNKKTKVIAVMMPNEEGIRGEEWESYKTTIDRIEQSTGYDFLSNVSKKIQKVLERYKFDSIY